MILDKNANLRVNPNNYKYLLELGYNNLKCNEIIKIPVEHLSDGSGHKILVKCDICGKEKYLQYRRYFKSFDVGGYYACSNKCNFEKKRDKLFSKESRKKTENTVMERYGVKTIMDSSEFRERLKNIFLEKYGVENPALLDSSTEKMKKTNLERYGVDNPSKSNIIKIKKENTSLKKYGVKYHLQSPDHINMFKNIKKYKSTDLYYQGTFELDFLEYCENNNILKYINNYRKGVKYIINNKDKVYFPDFFIEDINLIIEIKSTYTYNADYEKNKLKEKSCKDLGYNYMFIIDKNYEEFDNLIKEQNHTSI